MKIKLTPIRMDIDLIKAAVSKDTIVVNGIEYNFSPLKAGETLPISAFDGNHPFASDITRDEHGEICLTLLLPYSINAPETVRFPWCYVEPQTVVEGEVPMPEGYYNGLD